MIGIPEFVVRSLDLKAGDTFFVVFDDVAKTLTYVRAFTGVSGPRVSINGVVVESTLMP